MSVLPEFFSQKIFYDRRKLAIFLKQKYSQQKLVFTNGCFDILHPGHILYLHQARQLGDILAVGLNSDLSVKRLKGPKRPLHSWEDRALLLAALECTDFIVHFDEDTPEKSIEILHPRIHCKGGDYKPTELPEAALVERLGGQVHILPFRQGHSTSKLIQHIRQ